MLLCQLTCSKHPSHPCELMQQQSWLVIVPPTQAMCHGQAALVRHSPQH
jgi:hypothetical protein